MNKEKYVDESWKEQASEEKDKLTDSLAHETSPADGSQGQEDTTSRPDADATNSDDSEGSDFEMNFLNYITSLGYQAMIFMGEIPNPLTNDLEENMAQAKFLIDTLAMLKEKTAGNLNDQEKGLLESSVYELQMRYVQHVQNKASVNKEKARDR